MAQFLKAVKQHQQVIFSLDAAVGAQWLTPLPLFNFGIRGEIRHVKCRLDTGGPAGSIIDLYVADKSLSPMTAGVPKDEDVFYANIGTVLVASATTSSISDSPAAQGGVDYGVSPLPPAAAGIDSNLAVGVQLTTVAGGAHTILVDIWTEVQL